MNLQRAHVERGRIDIEPSSNGTPSKSCSNLQAPPGVPPICVFPGEYRVHRMPAYPPRPLFRGQLRALYIWKLGVDPRKMTVKEKPCLAGVRRPLQYLYPTPLSAADKAIETRSVNGNTGDDVVDIEDDVVDIESSRRVIIVRPDPSSAFSFIRPSPQPRECTACGIRWWNSKDDRTSHLVLCSERI
jgi:hypothetical protein